jgi:hypothetical protein
MLSSLCRAPRGGTRAPATTSSQQSGQPRSRPTSMTAGSHMDQATSSTCSTRGPRHHPPQARPGASRNPRPTGRASRSWAAKKAAAKYLRSVTRNPGVPDGKQEIVPLQPANKAQVFKTVDLAEAVAEWVPVAPTPPCDGSANRLRTRGAAARSSTPPAGRCTSDRPADDSPASASSDWTPLLIPAAGACRHREGRRDHAGRGPRRRREVKLRRPCPAGYLRRRGGGDRARPQCHKTPSSEDPTAALGLQGPPGLLRTRAASGASGRRRSPLAGNLTRPRTPSASPPS